MVLPGKPTKPKTMNKNLSSSKLTSWKADRAFMRNCAFQYRSVIAADYSPNLATKVRFGAEFLRSAIVARNESNRELKELSAA